jgi:RNA polymerase sigma-32 factor
MMQAAERFDPERGFRLATYAIWWVRSTIQQYILANWSLVKLGTTAAQKKLFFNLRSLKARLRALDDGDLPAEAVRAISTELAVPEADVVSMNRRLAGGDHSLNMKLSDDGEGEWQDRLVDEADDQEVTLARREELGQRAALLERAMRLLSDRERQIVRERHMVEAPETLEVLSRRHQLSRERVRQIETRALEKLRAVMARLAASDGIAARAAARRDEVRWADDVPLALPDAMMPVPGFGGPTAIVSHS